MKKLFLLLFSAALFACDVEKTESGEAPELDVDVQADAGELPEYDVDWANVTVETVTKTVEVPEVKVTMETKQVEVPSISVNIPDDDREKRDQTLMVEAEVSDRMHEIDIKKIYAVDDMLYVIATLEEGDQMLEGETVRISDQVELNAPDLHEKYYIIGQRPDNAFNRRYTYIASENEITDRLQGAELIYTD